MHIAPPALNAADAQAVQVNWFGPIEAHRHHPVRAELEKPNHLSPVVDCPVLHKLANRVGCIDVIGAACDPTDDWYLILCTLWYVLSRRLPR